MSRMALEQHAHTYAVGASSEVGRNAKLCNARRRHANKNVEGSIMGAALHRAPNFSCSTSISAAGCCPQACARMRNAWRPRCWRGCEPSDGGCAGEPCVAKPRFKETKGFGNARQGGHSLYPFINAFKSRCDAGFHEGAREPGSDCGMSRCGAGFKLWWNRTPTSNRGRKMTLVSGSDSDPS